MREETFIIIKIGNTFCSILSLLLFIYNDWSNVHWQSTKQKSDRSSFTERVVDAVDLRKDISELDRSTNG